MMEYKEEMELLNSSRDKIVMVSVVVVHQKVTSFPLVFWGNQTYLQIIDKSKEAALERFPDVSKDNVFVNACAFSPSATMNLFHWLSSSILD